MRYQSPRRIVDNVAKLFPLPVLEACEGPGRCLDYKQSNNVVRRVWGEEDAHFGLWTALALRLTAGGRERRFSGPNEYRGVA